MYGTDHLQYKFTLIRENTYTQEDQYLRHVDKLHRLKSDTFDVICVPEFSFTHSPLYIRIEMEYIKGRFVGVNDNQTLYDNLVLRDSEYSFTDYQYNNFIRCSLRHQIFAVDLLSYRKSSIKTRKFHWERQKNLRK